MSNKKQTAVDWLFDNLNLCFDKFDNGEYSYTEFVNASNEIKKQAKELEKKQIHSAFNYATKIPEKKQKVFVKWMESNMSVERRQKLMDEIPKSGQQYYEKTYEQTDRN